MKSNNERKIYTIAITVFVSIYLAAAVISFGQDTPSNSKNENTATDPKKAANTAANSAGTTPTPTPTPTAKPTPAVLNCDSKSETGKPTDPECRKAELAGDPFFKGLVAAVFMLILIPFVYIIYRSIKFSGATYRNPLGLPDGSIRAIIAYILVAFVGFYVLASVLSMTEFRPPEFLMGIVATVIGFYFGSRPGGERTGDAAASAGIHGKVTDSAGSPVHGAKVNLFKDGKIVRTEASNSSGEYEIKDVPSGKYEIEAVSGAQKSDKKALNLSSGKTDQVDLKVG